jgi:hypothetical protein
MADHTGDKVRENAARRAADRQGYRLVKARRRDPRALDFNRWHAVDKFTGKPIAGHDRRAGSSWLREFSASFVRWR